METRPVTRTQSLTNAEKAELWRAADTLRGHMDAAEYKHVVLGLIFLKHLPGKALRRDARDSSTALGMTAGLGGMSD